MAVVDMLEREPDLRSVEVRMLLVGRLERRVGWRLRLPEYHVDRDWYLRLVQGCFDDLPGGVSALVDAVGDLRPDSPLADRLCRLRDEWDAIDVAEDLGTLWEVLRDELTAVTARRGTWAFHEACSPSRTPRHCATAWHQFVWAASRVPAPGELTPPVRFLLRCQDLLTPGTWVRVEAWLYRQVHRSDLSAQLHSARLALAPALARRRHACVITLQLEPMGPGPDDHHASWTLRWTGSAAAWLGPARQAGTERFEEVTAAILDEAEAVVAAEIPVGEPIDLLVELTLPTQHLALPVCGWAREVDGSRRLLLQDYAIVLRSLDRLQWSDLARRRWQQRWAAYSEAAPGDVVVVEAARIGPFGLDAQRGITVVVLSGPPTPGSVAQRQLVDALRAGVAVAAWQRPESGRAAIDADLHHVLVHGEPRDLPHRLRAENLTRLDQSADPLGAHLHAVTLLYDDADRPPTAGGAARRTERPPAGGWVSPAAVTRPAPVAAS
ncbi:effector-associated domain 2-containing protein [Frankia canadensis]|nr:hypothetical protein [Frankia canadensis]